LDRVRVLSEITKRISVLREVDSAIDIARGWLQLRILIAIGLLGGADVNSIVSLLNERRKSVLDALRKMREKELINISNGVILLSSKGEKIFNIITGITGFNTSSLKSTLTHMNIYDRPVYDVYRDLTRSFYLYDAIIALGSSKNHELPLGTLAYISRISPEVLDDYLKVYTSPPIKLLKRITRTSKILFLKRNTVYYRLTGDGVKVYHRLPDYVKYKGSICARILRFIARSGHPRMVLKRIAFITSIGSAIAMTLTLIFSSPLSIVIMATWILLISFLALLVEITY